MEELKPSLSGRSMIGSHSRGNGSQMMDGLDMEKLIERNL